METSAWKQRSITRSNSGVESKPRRSNAIYLVTVERGKSGDTISFVKRNSLPFLLSSLLFKILEKFSGNDLGEEKLFIG